MQTASTGRASLPRRSQTACSPRCSQGVLFCSTMPPSTRPKPSPGSLSPCRRTAIRSSRSPSSSSPATIPSTAPAARSLHDQLNPRVHTTRGFILITENSRLCREHAGSSPAGLPRAPMPGANETADKPKRHHNSDRKVVFLSFQE